MKKDYIELECHLPWMGNSCIRVYRDDGPWSAQISFIRKDVQMSLGISTFFVREQIVELRDFLDSVLNETEAKE